jgi:Tfp pilus assembly PilM family ATPase
MAITCENRIADALCDTLDGAGIEPIAIDVPAMAAVRALPIDAENAQAILELEETRASIIVVHRGTIVFERVLSEMTLRTFRSQLAKAMRMPVAGIESVLHERGLVDDPEQDLLTGCSASVLEPFIEEIAHTAAYASSRFTDAQIQKVFLIGSASGIPGFAGYLSKSLECEFVAPILTELASPRGAVCSRTKPGQGVVALGLARWRSEAA